MLCRVRRIERVKAERDEGRAQTTLAALREGANGDANLLTLCVEAARARCTLGEMSAAMEAASGRHAVGVTPITGVYGPAYDDDGGWQDRKSTRLNSRH